MLFFTSNLYFNRYDVSVSRHFKSVEEMNGLIIRNWNNYVCENDTVYILGNIGSFDFLSELNGSKVLLLAGSDLVFYKKYIESISSERDDYYDKEMFEVFCENTYHGVHHLVFNGSVVVNDYLGNSLRLSTGEVKPSNLYYTVYGNIGNKYKFEKLFINSDISVNGYFPLSEVEVENYLVEKDKFGG